MEYTLTIRQVSIHKYFPSLDIKDAAILDFLGRFAQAKGIEKKFVGQTVFYWFDYKKISAENPLLRLNYEAMRKRMANLCKLGILESHPANKGGKVFFAFGENHEKTHRIENVDAYEASAKERNAKAEVGTAIPKQKKEVGTQIPKGRYADTEVLRKGRYQNTDNQYNHSNQNTIISNTNSENEFSPTTDDDAAQYFTVETHEPPKREVVRLDAKNATTSNGARRENFAALARNGGRVEDDEFGDFMAKEYGVKIVTVKTAEPIPETLGKSRKAKRQIGKPEPFEETKQAFCHFSNPDKIAALWSRWLEYKKEQHGERYKTEDSEKTQLRALWKMANGNADQAEKIIEQSIGNLWKGLFQLKTENENGRPKPVNKVLAQQDELARGLVEYYAHKRFATVE